MTATPQDLQFLPGVPGETQKRIRDFFNEIDKRKALGVPLREFEAPSYDDYLQSTEWRRIRRRVLKRDDRKCKRCEGRATCVHHRSYANDVLIGNNDDQLASVCEGCHMIIHFDEVGAKRRPEDTDQLLLQKHFAADFPAPKVDMRRKFPQRPSEWPRMTAMQRNAWDAEYLRLRLARMREKVGKRNDL